MHTTWANDPVNSPNHYTRSHPGMECIELTADTSFCLGNAIKYLWRYHSKGRPLEDLEKSPMVPMPSHRLRRKDRVDAPTVRHTHGTRRPHRRRRSQNMGKTQARLPRPRPRPHRRTHQTGKRQAMSTRIHCDQYGIPTDISELEAWSE